MSNDSSNPLRSLHLQAGAEFQAWADCEIVQTFGEPEAEYSAVRKACGLIDLPQFGILEFTGADRLSFLNNLLTNQTWNKQTRTGLKPGEGIYAFMLNVRGRIVTDMQVLELGERTWLCMQRRFVEPMRQLFEKFLFAEKVKMENRADSLHLLGLHGPGASEIIGKSLDSPLAVSPCNVGDHEAHAFRFDLAGVSGYQVVVDAKDAETIWKNLKERFATSTDLGRRALRPIGWAAMNALRIEAGEPMVGIDIDTAPVASAAPGKKNETEPAPEGGLLPAETGLFERAVSVTKGCYLGQEIVARMHARSQAAKKIVGIKMSDEALPMAGAQIFDESQSSQVGIITSSTISPILSNLPICLGLVKKSHLNIGTKLAIPAEGAFRIGTVCEMPFVPGAVR
jgi:folate-binding protein YgfZ